MKYFIYPLEKGICIYTYKRTKKTNSVLKLLETEYPCLIDCSKFTNIDDIVKELNFISGYTNVNINEFDFPLVFFGKVFIGNYDDLIKSQLVQNIF
jgi:hypothetical protein